MATSRSGAAERAGDCSRASPGAGKPLENLERRATIRSGGPRSLLRREGRGSRCRQRIEVRRKVERLREHDRLIFHPRIKTSAPRWRRSTKRSCASEQVRWPLPAHRPARLCLDEARGAGRLAARDWRAPERRRPTDPNVNASSSSTTCGSPWTYLAFHKIEALAAQGRSRT